MTMKMYDMLTEQRNMMKVAKEFEHQEEKTDTYSYTIRNVIMRNENTIFDINITMFTPDPDVVTKVFKHISRNIIDRGFEEHRSYINLRVNHLLLVYNGVNYIDVFDYIPREEMMNIKYDEPSISDIIHGSQYKVDLKNIPQVETADKWVTIAKKRAQVAYDVLKKGTINGVSYTLYPQHKGNLVPEIRVGEKNKLERKKEVTPHHITIHVVLQLGEISDRSKRRGLITELIKRFHKMGVKATIDGRNEYDTPELYQSTV